MIFLPGTILRLRGRFARNVAFREFVGILKHIEGNRYEVALLLDDRTEEPERITEASIGEQYNPTTLGILNEQAGFIHTRYEYDSEGNFFSVERRVLNTNSFRWTRIAQD